MNRGDSSVRRVVELQIKLHLGCENAIRTTTVFRKRSIDIHDDIWSAELEVCMLHRGATAYIERSRFSLDNYEPSGERSSQPMAKLFSTSKSRRRKILLGKRLRPPLPPLPDSAVVIQ
jgi:hypothetical protein